MSPAEQLDSTDGQTSSSTGSLLGDITRDLSELVRQELQLAKAELSETATRTGKGAGLLAGAGVAGHFVLLFLSIALWWGLGHETGRGWSAVIVAAVWAVIAAILALIGKKDLTASKKLDRTVDSVKKIPPALKGHEELNS